MKTVPVLFLSYRRGDSLDVTGRIYDRLVEYFGRESVFRDIDSIPLGVSFPDLLRETLSRTDAVLVIIGPAWLSVTNEHGQRRLEEANDFVRMEVETALQLDVPVIPVVVSTASLPEEHELPQSVRALAHRHGFAVRPAPDFHRDMNRLCTKLQEVLQLPEGAVRKSEAVDRKLDDLHLQNKRLQAELALQNELMTTDGEWEKELERHKVRYGQGSARKEPTLGGTVFVAIFYPLATIAFAIFLGFMTTFSINAFGDRLTGDPLYWIGAVIFVVALGFIGIITPIYFIRNYVSYAKARKRYQQRRDAAIRRFNERIDA